MASTEKPRIGFLLALAGFTALGLPGAALGQLALPSIERTAPNWNSDFDFSARYQKGTAIDAGGSFKSAQYEATTRLEGPLSQTIQFNLEASYTYTDYDFGSASASACSQPAACFTNDPWQSVNRLDVAPGASLALSPSMRLRISFPIRWNAEGNSDANGVTAGMVAQFQWELSHDLVVGLGIGVRNELEEDVAVYPAISLDWKLGPSLGLHTRGGPYRGGALELVWRPSDFFQGVLSAGYERQRFRLGGSGPNANGVTESTSIPLLVGLEFVFSSRLKVVAEGGMAVSGELKIEDQRGLPLASSHFDSAALLRGRLAIAF